MDKMSVLVVDDTSVIRDCLMDILGMAGCDDVHTAEDGTEALERLKQTDYQIVITDVRHPGPDGIELLKHITEKHPQTKVIIVTGEGNIKKAVSAMKLDAFDYIEKPFNPNDILLTIRRAIEQRTCKK